MPRGRELRLASGSLSHSAHCLFCRQGFVTTLVIVVQALSWSIPMDAMFTTCCPKA
jgi:hypothetical protein